MEDLRRVDDRRFTELGRDLGAVKKDVREIRDMLITEPEASPLGRSLKGYGMENRTRIAGLETRVDSLESSRDKVEGSLATARLIQVLVTLIVGLLAIYQFVVPK